MDLEPSNFLVSNVFVNSPLVISSIVLTILLLCSALISGAEVALFSLTKADLDLANTKYEKQINIISALLKHPKKLLATILVANNFINIAIVILFAYLGEFIFLAIKNSIVRFLIEVVFVTVLILLFGEIIPKIYASRNRIKFSLAMARPLKLLDTVFAPVSLPLRFITTQIQNKLGKQKSNLSVDQLSQALELTNTEDTTEEEQQILESIVTFGNTDTKQVMRPRLDIFALSIDLEFNDIIPDIITNGYSRIPVFKENIDNIKGILYVKDLLPHLQKKSFDWTRILREPFFVPENKKLDDLMQEFSVQESTLSYCC